MKPVLGTVVQRYDHHPTWGGAPWRTRRKGGWLIIQAIDHMGRACYTIWIKEDK